MRQVISIHIGQAGAQVGSTCWELFCLEHGISPDGSSDPPPSQTRIHTFFEEHKPHEFRSRSVFVDLEPSAIDGIRTGDHRFFYAPDQLVSGSQGASGNYALGRYTLGPDVMGRCMDQVRRLAEHCDDMEGFLVTSAVAGGTGSGLGHLVLDNLNSTFESKQIMSCAVYPSSSTPGAPIAPIAPIAPTAPYNTVLSTSAMVEHTNMIVILDNTAMYDLCRQHFGLGQPALADMNDIAAHAIASMTRLIRFDGSLPGLVDLEQRLVPYPSINLLMASVSPMGHAQASDSGPEPLGLDQLVESVFNPDHQLVKCDPRYGTYLVADIFFQGDIEPRHAWKAIKSLKSRKYLKFVDWSPAGVKGLLSRTLPVALPGGRMGRLPSQLCMVASSTAVNQLINRIDYPFDAMFERKTLVQKYLDEGMELGEFVEARKALTEVERDYDEVGYEFFYSEDEY